MTAHADEQHAAGYSDGRDPESLDPGPNTTDEYRHSFAVGRAEIAGRPIPAHISRARAQAIEERWK